MTHDTVLRGATVVDGTGSPRVRADVAVDGGRITEVSPRIASRGALDVDLDGLVLAPGFIDIHTHYDAQVFWDPDLTPSSWHGVTSVVMGNCGFGIAPTRPDHRELIMQTLETVEDIAATAMAAGVRWSFETFPEYLAAVEALPKRLNVGVLAGHTPVRLYVMGDAATEREADAAEVERMAALVAEAVATGAIGFATSKSPTHQGARGLPVPSRFAALSEVRALARAAAGAGGGLLQATSGPGLNIDEYLTISAETGLPVTSAAMLTGIWERGGATSRLDRIGEASLPVFPQVSCRPLVMLVSMRSPFPLMRAPSVAGVLAVPEPERAALYRDPAWRERARGEVLGIWERSWPTVSVAESVRRPELVGRRVADVAAERGCHLFDAMLDIALSDDLDTRFEFVLANDDEDELGDLLRDHRTVLGLSDAGAHASQICDACFSTHLLGHWVRELGALSLEDAVWRLAGQPATLLRLADRGVIRPGAVADLVAFDAGTVGPEPARRVRDLPGGEDRLLAGSRGVVHVWVGGQAIRRDGEPVPGAHPGSLLRRRFADVPEAALAAPLR